MADFTPGPWTAGHFADDTHSCDCRSILSDTGIFGAVATVHTDNGKRIADGGNDAPPASESKANMCLIAAAPDMYEALRMVIELRDNNSNAVGGELWASWCQHPAGYKAASDALAKADGK